VIVKSVNIHDANETKNVNLSFNYYCRGLGDNPFICDCDMVPLQTYLSDMTLLDTGATCHNKNDQSLNSLYEFEYFIEEMKHTSDRSIFYILVKVVRVQTHKSDRRVPRCQMGRELSLEGVIYRRV
jgi:hypothetical protein